MAERGIIFSAPMVRAILEGRKTVTRRVVKLRYAWEIEEADDGSKWPWHPDYVTGGEWDGWAQCPYGEVGDRLWVRETHAIFATHGQHRDDGKRWGPWGGLPTAVSPDGTQIAYFREGFDRCYAGKWRPSIHIPRWASRITLEVTAVRVERLQDISYKQALAEGITSLRDDPYVVPGRHFDVSSVEVGRFRDLWESINGAGSWAANPWVWVVEFKRIEKEVPDGGG